MRATWSEHLSVGNGEIDLDHKFLFGLIDGVVHAIEANDCLALSRAFELLENKLRSHFSNVERIAETVKFPFTRHKEAQIFLLKELENLKDELQGKAGVWCEAAVKHYSDILRGLLMDHITDKDMLMKPLLQNYPYDLTVAGLCRDSMQSNYIEAHHGR
ncbi:MAG: hypothetical protein OEV23_02520 [Gallionella sp.]|nr:hypothetical protein [Gallionella sp.]